MRAYLRHLYAEMRPQGECCVWYGWVRAVAALGYADYAELAERLLRRSFVDPFVMRLEDFQADLRRTLADPERLVGFEEDHLAPFGDAIETLANWYYFTEAYKKDHAREAARRAVEQKYGSANRGPSHPADAGSPYIDQFRHVGRNQPCPCGSGKKYKKCCLAESTRPAPLAAAQ